jgi:hypothetical protein
MARPKKTVKDKPKSKGVAAIARTSARKVEAVAAKKRKRLPSDENDVLPDGKIKKMGKRRRKRRKRWTKRKRKRVLPLHLLLLQGRSNHPGQISRNEQPNWRS